MSSRASGGIPLASSAAGIYPQQSRATAAVVQGLINQTLITASNSNNNTMSVTDRGTDTGAKFNDSDRIGLPNFNQNVNNAVIEPENYTRDSKDFNSPLKFQEVVVTTTTEDPSELNLNAF